MTVENRKRSIAIEEDTNVYIYKQKATKYFTSLACLYEPKSHLEAN